MSPSAFSVVLIVLVLAFTWQAIYTANKDLARARAWGELARRALPFVALLLMAVSLPLVGRSNATLVWVAVFAALIIAASFLSVSPAERRANRAFKRGDYETAARLFGELAEKKPLPRNHAFLGAALGGSGKLEEAVEASTKAIEKDPEYGLAYYNRALILLRMNKNSRAKKDFQRALEADLPRRFRQAVRRHLEEAK